MNKLRCFDFYIVYLARRFIKEGFTYRAASLAYTTLLAIVPLSIISFGILSFFPFFKGVGSKLQDAILQNFVAGSAETISKHLSLFLKNVSALSWHNILFLTIVGLLMIFNINKAFQQVWKTQKQVRLSISFLIYFVVLMVSPLIFGGMMVLGSFALRLVAVTHVFSSGWQQPLFFLLRHGVVFLVFTIFNWVLPFCRVKFRHALVGGFIATILFESAKWGFVAYLNHFASYRLIYGALATVPIFLIWLYVSWTIILLSALITHLVAHGIPQTEWKKLENELR